MTHEIDLEIQQATDRALQGRAAAQGLGAAAPLFRHASIRRRAEFEAEPSVRGEPRTMVDAINLTLHEEMARDRRSGLRRGRGRLQPRGKPERSEGQGRRVQGDRTACRPSSAPSACFNTPIAEAAIVGRAIGMATRGLKPVAEIQFFDYIWPAMMQIRDEMATLRWRSNNGVVRARW